MWKGPELKDDPIYLDRLAKGLIEAPEGQTPLVGTELMRARGSVVVFLLAALLVVALGLVPSMRPSYTVPVGGGGAHRASRNGACHHGRHACGSRHQYAAVPSFPVTTVKGSIMSAGMVALISIAGLGWLGSSFFEGNRHLIIGSISGVVQQHPWVFAIGLFVLSILLASQAATIVTLVPVGIALGISSPVLIALFPAVNGYFFLPTYQLCWPLSHSTRPGPLESASTF